MLDLLTCDANKCSHALSPGTQSIVRPRFGTASRLGRRTHLPNRQARNLCQTIPYWQRIPDGLLDRQYALAA
jgi:hypothetical protein